MKRKNQPQPEASKKRACMEMPPSDMKETSMEENATFRKGNDDGTPMWAHLENPDTDL